MLKAPLQHAASIRMGGQVENIAAESVDEGEAVGRYTFNQFLDHLQKAGSATLKLYHRDIYMVSVRVFDTSQDMNFQLPDESTLLIW
jgi:hypothetical protein